jgi:large conductance mechanosensitive channel
MAIVEEFKAFAMRGNVVDMAVGIVIGGAFGAIVNSLVGDVITPAIGLVTGGVDFSGLAYMIGDANLAYGKFIQSVFSFVIVAFSLFMLIKGMNRLRKTEEEKPSLPPEPSEEVKLLREIRDSLAKR